MNFREKIRFLKFKKKKVQSLKNRMNRSEDCISKMEGKVGNLPKEIEKKIQTENTNRRPAGHRH